MSQTAIAGSTSELGFEAPLNAARPPRLAGGSPLRGHLDQLSADDLALYARCAALHGIVQFRVYWFNCHVVTDPGLAHAVLVTQAAAFQKTRALQVARPTFGNGLVTAEGETWRRQQRQLRPFFTPRAAEGYNAAIASAIARKLDTWQPSQRVDLHGHMVDVSLEIVCSALFGVEAARFQPLIRDASQAVQQWHSDCKALCLPYPHYLPTLSNLRYRRQSRKLDRAVYALIRELRAHGGEGHGLLGSLLEVKQDDGSSLSDQEIRDQLVTFFLAGHDTTAASVSFALCELSHRPDLQARIVEELDADAPSATLEHVLQETLRLYPAVHLVARTAIRDVILGGYLVRRGEEVVLPLYVIQRGAKLFTRPDEFEPERWAKAAGKGVCPRHAHIPFSLGPRVCIGQAMAMAELRAIVSAVVRRFRLESLAPRAPRLDNRLTLSPAPGSTQVRLAAR